MGKKLSKKQTQKRIARYIADGRISSKEAKKAQRSGISLARIQKAQTKSFQPGNVFSLPGTAAASAPTPASKGPSVPPPQPSYSPLVIQGAAQKVFDQPTRSASPNINLDPNDPNIKINDSGKPNPNYPVDSDPEPADVYDPFADFMANSFPVILDSLKPQEYEPLPLPSGYSSIGAAAQSAPGVKARRSAASRRMASTLGTRGAFNRGGLRISNLNI
mgnify:FL=1